MQITPSLRRRAVNFIARDCTSHAQLRSFSKCTHLHRKAHSDRKESLAYNSNSFSRSTSNAPSYNFIAVSSPSLPYFSTILAHFARHSPLCCTRAHRVTSTRTRRRSLSNCIDLYSFRVPSSPSSLSIPAKRTGHAVSRR